MLPGPPPPARLKSRHATPDTEGTVLSQDAVWTTGTLRSCRTVMGRHGRMPRHQRAVVGTGVTLLALVLLLAFDVAVGVDRNNFKGCKDSSFCRRNRAIQVTDYCNFVYAL